MKIRLHSLRVFIITLMLSFSISFVNATTITITSTPTGGLWSATTTWVGGVVPTSSDNVIVASGSTITVSVNALSNNLSVLGTGILTINNGITLTIYGNVAIDSGAQFNAGTGNSDSATILVYGNFTNDGTANFWKSIVVIAGNLDTASTILQNNGNIIVGGNISGVIGGSGSGTVYPVNSDAIVIDTGNANDKPAGTLPPTGILLDLTNQVIYGGSCSFTINDITNVSTCSGSNTSFMVVTSASTPTYLWQVNINDGSGWNNLSNDATYSGISTSTLTISNEIISMNNYKYRAKVTAGSTPCTKNGNYGVLTINQSPAAPTASVTLQPTCSILTGTITVSTLTGMNYSIDGSDYSNTTGVFTSVAPGTFNVTAKNGTGCISASTIVTIVSSAKTWNGSSSADWNTASNWTPIGVPTSSNCVIIPNVTTSPIISAGDAVANTLTVFNLGKLFVNSANTITVTDFVNVNTGGSFTFDTNASLVQINNTASNIGNITYSREVPVINSTDYTYWSSPVSGQNLKMFSPNTPSTKFYSFDPSIEDWRHEVPTSKSMDKGIGYCIYGPQLSMPPSFFLANFIGIPNNGIITVPIVFSGAAGGTSNLIGNPYPSALDADNFLAVNSGVIDGTLYFWTHNTPISTNGQYTSNDYAVYNTTGGTAASAPSDPNHLVATLDKGKIPLGKIASGEGFFVTSLLLNGTLIFDNSMRVDASSNTLNNSQFFKSSNTHKNTAISIEKDRVWLNLSNSQGAFKQTLIGYITDATNGYDSRFDGESFDGNEFVDFYSVNKDKNLTIQGRALPFDESDEVPLGFRSSIDGDFTINIDQVDGLFTNQSIFVEDKLTNISIDLKVGNYTFTTVAGTFNDRFVLRYTNKSLATANFEAKTSKVLVSAKSKQIKVNSSAERIEMVSIYDLSGRQIYQKSNVNTNELSIANLVSSHQTLVVKTSLENGEMVTDKIIF